MNLNISSDHGSFVSALPTNMSLPPTRDATSPSSSGDPTSIVASIAFGLSTSLIVASNLLTLVVLRRKPDCFEEIPHQIFLALGFTDLLTGLSCSFLSFLFSFAPQLQGIFTCTVRTMSCTGCLNQSALTMAFATVDRLIAITRPLRYPSVMTLRRARTIIAIFAVISISNALFTNVGADFASMRAQGSCVSDFSAVGIGIPFRPSLIVILLIFYGSLLVATLSNISVVRIALRHARHIANIVPPPEPASNVAPASNLNPNPSRVKRKAMKSLWTVMAATIAFYVAVIPWNVMASLYFAKHVMIPASFRLFAAFLLINNSWWNTVIYAVLNSTFRRAAKQVIDGLRRCCWCSVDDRGEDSNINGATVISTIELEA